MQLKKFQRKVVNDLERYLAHLKETGGLSEAYKAFWEEKNVPVGLNGMPHYQNIIEGVPNVCFKVPTGGGKTFIACNSIKPIYDVLPISKAKAVVWLVPSEAILTQTINNLKNPEHPYHQQLVRDFHGAVQVYTKEELLSGQNFNPIVVTEQLSVMVLSFDSFRGRSNDAKRAYKENENLATFSRVFGSPNEPIKNADETALYQVINQLNPVVIVDESHHARTNLSIQMLKDFNPCFVLDLTATPKDTSNIISFIDAYQLKKEHMVKLPVIVYNRDSQKKVIVDAIDLRYRLEQQAIEEQKESGRYIRPIVLFQAEPKNSEDATTFKKLKKALIDLDIPEEQIAIKTADINELKNVDLNSRECEIRYIITVNALKEGWDCPFAYVLATIANKSSKVDVEQILGRILRQPYAVSHRKLELNLSYVLTSSNNFSDTLENIVSGLNRVGFSEDDYRVASPLPEKEEKQEKKATLKPVQTDLNDFLDFDPVEVKQELKDRRSNTNSEPTSIDDLFAVAQSEVEAFEEKINQTDDDDIFTHNPDEVVSKMNVLRMNSRFEAEMKEIKLPMFFREVGGSLFQEENYVLFEQEHLAETFTLKGKPYDIELSSIDSNIMRVDLSEEDGNAVKVFKMNDADQKYFRKIFHDLSDDRKIKMIEDTIVHNLNKENLVESSELRNYVHLVISNFDNEDKIEIDKRLTEIIMSIRTKIKELLDEHYYSEFKKWVETEKITLKPGYSFPESINPTNYTTIYAKSLYKGEEAGNKFEEKLLPELAKLPNIKWWHRNISRLGFRINGYQNHYPDFIVMTNSGKLILIETKGDHLDNEKSRKKRELGALWQNIAGQQSYRYYMVFESIDVEGAYNLKEFIDLLKDIR